jgi:hypothetical protein
MREVFAGKEHLIDIAVQKLILNNFLMLQDEFIQRAIDFCVYFDEQNGLNWDEAKKQGLLEIRWFYTKRKE